MTIDIGLLSIIVTVLLSIIGLAFGLGALNQKVNGHDKDIAAGAKDGEISRKENREEHQRIFDKLEEINKSIHNGK